MKRVVLLGPPGAGKGTQSIVICGSLGIPQIATGDILRAAVQGKTELGLQAKSFMDNGQLVPDELVIGLMRVRLLELQEKGEDGFLLDGFPRTLAQAEALDGLLQELRMPLTHVVDLKVDESVLLERIRQRSLQGSGRSDDSAEVATERLKVYWADTAPVSGYYRSQGNYHEVDGLGSVEEVSERILKCLGHVF
ncbi:adenylate kinase [bacterium]|nr:adenylate kinase [bacterium]